MDGFESDNEEEVEVKKTGTDGTSAEKDSAVTTDDAAPSAEQPPEQATIEGGTSSVDQLVVRMQLAGITSSKEKDICGIIYRTKRTDVQCVCHLVTNLCKLMCFQVKQPKKVGINCLEVDLQTDIHVIQNTINMKICVFL